MIDDTKEHFCMAGWGVLGRVGPFQHTCGVWTKCLSLSGLTLFMHCVLGCFGYHQRCVGRFVHVGLIKSVNGGIHLKDGQQWDCSKVERRE